MIFGEGPIIKNIAGDLNKLFLQGTRAGQPINNVEGDAAADQATIQLMADRDPVIRDISTGLGWAGRDVTVFGTGALQLVNSLGRPLKSWSVELAPYQEGSGDPSPDNVRPIHGTHKLTVWTSGPNLLPTYTSSITQSGVTYTANPDGSITVNGTATATQTFYADSSTWQWDGVSDAWLSGCPAGGNYMNGYSLRVDPISSGYSSPDTGSGVRLSGYSGQYNLSNTPLRFCIVVRSGTVCDNLIFRPMLNYGLSALPYQPYISPSQTVIDIPALGKNILNIEAGTHNAWSFVNIPNNLKPNTQYTLSLNGGTTYYYGLYLGNSQQSTRALTQAITGGESATFTTPSDMSTEPLLALAGSVSGAGNESLSNILPQVELGSTKTSYEPYTNTIYSGTIGGDSVESRWKEIDLGKISWTVASSYGANMFMTTSITDINPVPDFSGMLCEAYMALTSNVSFSAMPMYSIKKVNNGVNIFVKDDRFTDAQSFQNALNGVKFVYECITPTVLEVTTPSIPTTDGNGTIWVTAEDGIVTSFSATYLQAE